MFSKFTDSKNNLTQWFIDNNKDFIKIRQELHQKPELSKKEFQTTKTITDLLSKWGITTDQSLLPTGVIGVIKKGNSHKRIGLRADIDALPIKEETNLAYESLNDGIMHACGHDGHTTMLLFAAKYLQQKADFDGEILLIFQPNEEDSAGARDMIEAGLFEKYPVDAIYAFHNFPGEAAGNIMINSGPQMAGTVSIEIDINGIGCHAAHPYRGVDTVLVASHVIVALQSITSRNLPATDSAVISITTINGGTANNIIPNTVKLTGTLRYFDLLVKNTTKDHIKLITENICKAFGAKANIKLTDNYISTINHDSETQIALDAANKLFSSEYIITNKTSSMGAEDFGFMLEKQKGAYLYIGNGPDSMTNKLHNSAYDFNDTNLVYGGAYWATLALHFLNLS